MAMSILTWNMAETLGDKVKHELDKNATYCFEQILEMAFTATSHHTNHQKQEK